MCRPHLLRLRLLLVAPSLVGGLWFAVAVQAAASGHFDSSAIVERARQAVVRMASPSADRASALLPAGSLVESIHRTESIAIVDLLLPWGDDPPGLSMAQIEHVCDALADAIDPQRRLAGVVVRFRTKLDGPYRPLESLAADWDGGSYPDPPEGVEPVTNGSVTKPTGQAHSSAPIFGRAAGDPRLGSQPDGALSGVVVYVNAGHGWTAGSSSWFLQRGLLHDMIEDYGNLEQLNSFVELCHRAGATVVPFRPVGYQPIEIVLDQDDPEVSYDGAWSNSSGSPYYENNRTVSGVHYRFASASAVETALARYTPVLPATDFYPVYTWVLDSTNRTTQTYRIVYAGGATEVVVDHRLVGKGWVWLGNYYFEAGTGGYVEISNRSSAGGVVIADAIRLGSGLGDVAGAGPGTPSGYPRDEEAARYWAESEAGNNAVGLPSSIWDCCAQDIDDNVGTAARWAREMNNQAYDNDRWRRVYLEFHSNAADGSARGTVALITQNATAHQAEFAQILGEEIEGDMLLLDVDFEHAWAVRNPNTYLGSFGAISTTNNGDEFDATILEVAFHDNPDDAELLLDPKVREAVARSSVHALVKFLHSLPGSGVPLAFAPERPARLSLIGTGAGEVQIAWQPPPAGEAYGDPPSGYRIYRSLNGYGFDGGLDVGDVLSATLTDVPAGQTTFMRVAAYNAGGESPPSETLAVRLEPDGPAEVLIVNGFDRIDRAQDPRQSLAGIGVQRRPILRHVNSRDYAVQHGLALASAGVSFDACANEAVLSANVNLLDYPAVVWICGEESSGDATFDAQEQSLLTQYLSVGGSLLVSGAEIAWDLDYLNNGRAFYRNMLGAQYAADDAQTYQVSPTPGGLFDGLPAFALDDGTMYYDAEFPDVLTSGAGAEPALYYAGGTGGVAAVAYEGAFRVVNLGFPFEIMMDPAARAALAQRVMAFFGLPDGVSGDVDGDQDVDLTDLSLLLVAFGACSGDAAYLPAADFNDSGCVDLTDLSILLANYGA